MSAAAQFWTMTKGKIMEGVFAVNKPSGVSSAQVLRDMQKQFNPSKLFAPWIKTATRERDRESHNQKRRRRDKIIQVKIGHGGTLDPLATGVLITGVGSGTKSLQDFLLCTKTYETVILFGTSTDSYDRVGKVLKSAPYEHITKEMVEKALGQFRGKIQQTPPLFSALKMNGKPLYEYAREGKPIPREIEKRNVEVSELVLLEFMEGGTHPYKAPTEAAGRAEINVANQVWEQEKLVPAEVPGKNDATKEEESRKRKLSEDQDDLIKERPASKQKKPVASSEDAFMSGGLPAPSADAPSTEDAEVQDSAPAGKGPPAVRIRMTVSSGTYVRSIAHDLGLAVGSAAIMSELERTRQAQFTIGENVLEYKDLAKGEEVWGPQVETMLEDWYQQGVVKENKRRAEEQRMADKESEDVPVAKEETTSESREADAVVNEETVGEIKAGEVKMEDEVPTTTKPKEQSPAKREEASG